MISHVANTVQHHHVDALLPVAAHHAAKAIMFDETALAYVLLITVNLWDTTVVIHLQQLVLLFSQIPRRASVQQQFYMR